jgi:hypothetical protein
MSLIQSWIIYTGGLGGGGAGGTGCTKATGFSVFIFSMLSELFSVRKTKIMPKNKEMHRSDSFLILS